MLEELKNENVKFKKMSEEEAIKYLEQNNIGVLYLSYTKSLRN